MDSENYKYYEIDPTTLKYTSNKYDCASEFCVPRWLRGLGWDDDLKCMLQVITAYGDTEMDSCFIAALDPEQFCPKGGLPGNGRIIVNKDKNLRSVTYNDNFQNSQTDCSKVYYYGGWSDYSYIWICASFSFDGTGFKTTTWGAIKKLYKSGSIGKSNVLAPRLHKYKGTFKERN